MFVELLAQSCFSFHRGASHPEELVDQAHRLGLDGLSVCDRDGLYGSVRAYARSRELGQRIIIGAELGVELVPTRKFDPETCPTLALFIENHRGYENLCRLLTLAHADRPKGESSLRLEALTAHAEGLIAVIPAPRCPGEFATPPSVLLERVKAVFEQRAYLAMYRHLDGFDREREHWVMRQSHAHALSIIASARPLLHHRSRKPLSDVLHCIRLGKTLDEAGALLSANREGVLRSETEMLRLFSDHPDWVARTAEVAASLNFQLSELDYQFPCNLDEGESADEKLRRLTEAGLARRYPAGTPNAVQTQVERELEVIQKLDVAPYFLSTWEIVEIARQKRILCQGRGSAANSAVCYALGITAVDPARSNLLFERFISIERKEPPDIDIDFEHERREEVIQEIYARYGRDRAAMVSEVICYRGKSALRAVGKVFGLSSEQLDRLSGALTHWDTADLSEARLKEMGFDAGDVRVRQVVTLAQSLQGFPRHLSIHVGGFVLSARPIYEVAPVEPARMDERTVVPWDKDDLEVLGFFKVDVLGLGMLTAIRKALALIHQDGALHQTAPPKFEAPSAGGCMANPGSGPLSSIAESPKSSVAPAEAFDPIDVIARIPAEDSVVYDMICRADTVGVFQIESRAQMAMLPRLRPRCYYDLVIEVAIVRPGPIQGGMVHPYLRRRCGEEPVSSPHPELWPILERTLGVPLFQEQVMQIATTAGYTGGEADQLRRDMAAWRKTGRLMRHREKLLNGFAKKGIDPKFGEALFEQIKGFGDYGFPESHSASFAILVYTSAWQKAHFPAHFACALLNAQPMGFYSPSTIVRDVQRHGVEVRDVDISCSEWDCTLEKSSAENRIQSQWPQATASTSSLARPPSPDTGHGPQAERALRLGFRLVKGFGELAAQRIVTARAEHAFSSLEDLIRRARLKKNEVEALAEAGALEPLVKGRRQALWKARAPRIDGLYEKLELREPEVHLPTLSSAEQLVLDYGRKGLSVNDHPLSHLRKRLNKRGVVVAERLCALKKGTPVQVAGLVLSRQQPSTASGVVFMTLEDETGFVNLIVYRQVFEKYRLVARHSTIILAEGNIERENPRTLADGNENGQSPASAKTVGPTRPSSPVASNKPASSQSETQTPVIHVIVRHFERLDAVGRGLRKVSRDFR